METVSCNLCGADDARLVFDVPDWSLDRPEVRARLVRCERCGLMYQNPRPTLAEMGQHYPDEYELYTPAPEAKNLPRLLRWAYQYGMAKRRGFVTRRRSGGRLLDVGCATGVFLNSLRQAPGWEAQGVEVSPRAAQIARDQYGLTVFTGTLEAARFPDAAFDAITLWDVFEHLHDPAASLRELKRLLKPGGLLVLRVPNGGGWDAALFGPYWAGLEPPRHLYIFTAATIGRMLAQGGFRVLEQTSASAAYTTFVFSVQFWLKGRGSRAGRWLLPLLYHPVSRVLSAPLFWLASLGRRGPLLVVTAESQ